jgi:hypothetical protein
MNEMSHNSEPLISPKHETRDADIHKLILFGIACVVLIGFGFIITEIVVHVWVPPRPASAPATLYAQGGQIPPRPRLEQHPGETIGPYMRMENHLLNSYGWVNRQAGTVRVPIQQAMSMLLQKGVPVRNPSQITSVASEPHMLPRGDFAPPAKGVPGPEKQ